MQTWLAVFIAVTAVAVVLQLTILAALYFQMRRTTENVNRLVGELQARVGPILTRIQILLDDTQPRISSMVTDASHIVYLARGQAQRVDRILTEAADRLRGQLVHADRILTGALEAVEEAGSQFRTNFWRPVRKASALVQGIKVGLDLLRSRRGRVNPDEPLEHEEELFI
jgi:anti-sigma-K factor RskA